MVKVILDTNVWISALFFESTLSEILELWKNEKFITVFSNETFAEIKEKFLLWSKKSNKELFISEYLKTIRKKSFFVYPQKHFTVCPHEADNKFFDAAHAAKADYLVSGDRQVLKTIFESKTKILSPKEFLQTFTY